MPPTPDDGEHSTTGETEAAWSVYDELPPAEIWRTVDQDLSKWKQGQLLLDVPVTWLMPGGIDRITSIDSAEDSILPASLDSLRATAAIICSQTCDIGASAPGDKHPFILVAPLISDSQISKEETKLALEYRVGYLFPTLSPPGNQEGTQWFADLRLMVPASKSILLGREPIDGFSTESDSLAFCETIAQKFRRVALDETLSDKLLRALRKFVVDNGRRSPVFTKVEQVRLSVLDRDRLNPGRANLLVLSDVPLDEAERGVWGRFQVIAEGIMNARGIRCAPMTFTNADELSARSYRASVPIWCDLLRHTRYP